MGSRRSAGHSYYAQDIFYGILFMVPVITVVTSVLVLKEPVTWISAVGTVMAAAGLFLSEYSGKENRKNE